MRAMKNARAFTLIELLVVIGIIGVLLAILLPSLEKVREQANTARCASNLHQIGTALVIYADENDGRFPRTRYVPGAPVFFGTGAAAPDPFSPGGPGPNDVTAPLFLLMRAEHLPAKIFADPYNDVNVYVADTTDPQKRSNWTDYRKNLAYSYADPYPEPSFPTYELTTKVRAGFGLAADLSPTVDGGKNSRNHEGRGQNVLFADAHVSFETTPECGLDGDDIYASRSGPHGPNDSVLLPSEE